MEKDSIFFGLRGEHFDGNQYAAEALNRGARFAVVDDPSFSDGGQYIRVGDSLSTLQELAAHHRAQLLRIPVVAITGSNGKTTTKELVADLLSSKYRVRATLGNLNNHIGVPLTLLGMDSDTEIGIVEMGANHAGEIALLCRLARPDCGLITNIGQAHLEGFGSLEGVRKAKGELYGYLAQNGGLTFCHAGNRELLGMLDGIDADVLYYGGGSETVCSAETLSSDPFLSLRLRIRDQEAFDVKTGLVGEYNLENILAAVAVALHFGIGAGNIREILEDWSLDNNRSQRIETGSNILIMDAYNANPTSMKAALDNFSRQDHPRKVVLLGDMLELGEQEIPLHREVLEYLKDGDFSEIFLVGPVFSGIQKTTEGIRTFRSVGEAGDWLERNPPTDRMILIKGSRGMGLEKLKGKL